MILSDLCNQNCHFCLVSGTRIETTSGLRPIEDIKVGDHVIGGDMTPQLVTEVSACDVVGTFVVLAGGRRLQGTENHPIFTDSGWVPMGWLSKNHRVVILGDDRKLSFFPIDSIGISADAKKVHNFTCEPGHTYIASGMVVHNCAYRDPSYTSSQLFHINGNYNPNRMLPFEKVVEILDDCVEMGVRAVQLTGGGEPTVHPRFQEIAAEINKRGLAWALVTNGVRAAQYDLLTAAWVRVSLDAATPETYARIRRVDPGHFAKACETIRRNRCGVGFVVTPENWREVEDATELARDLGASNIRIGAQFSEAGGDLFAGIRNLAANYCREAERLGRPGFEVINRFSEKLGDLDQGAPDYGRCGYQHFTTYIGADQNLYRCCVYAYHPRGLIGSIQGRRLKDVWQEVAAADFAKFDATSCKRCQFNTINRAINEVVTPDPSEVFV